MKLSDHDIIRKILEGNICALELLIDRYEETVFRTCLRFMKNQHDAEDLTQEIFITIYNNLDKFKSSFSTWLYRICVNSCLNELKKQNRLETEFRDTLYCKSTYGDPEKALQSTETMEIIDAEISKMNEKSQKITKMRLFKDMPFKEIAKKLKIPASSARTSFFRSRKALKQRLSDYKKESD